MEANLNKAKTRYPQAATRYARAIFEVSIDNGTTNLVLQAFRDLKEALDKLPSEFQEISSPVIGTKDQHEVFLALQPLGFPEEFTSLISLLIEKKRLALLPYIAGAFEQYSDTFNKVARGSVKSTTDLGREDRLQIEDLISRVTGKKAILDYRTSPQLLGGLVANVDGYTFDDSLETQLNLLSDFLKRRSN